MIFSAVGIDLFRNLLNLNANDEKNSDEEEFDLVGCMIRSKQTAPNSKRGKSSKMRGMDDFADLAKGLIIGSFLGDATGSYLILYEDTISPDLVRKAMELPGGGRFELNPGQITEDSELAISLMDGLIEGKGKFSLESIIKNYRKWIFSNPFDLGETIRNALVPLLMVKDDQNYSEMIKVVSIASQKHNIRSQGNGALMRIAPLAIWCARLKDLEDFETVIRLEVGLTHPNITVQDAAICYCLAIKHLLSRRGDVKGVFSLVDSWISKRGLSRSQIGEWWEIVKEGKMISATENAGWLKIAWTYAFISLKGGISSYEEIIEKILSLGGATDSNASIVGGLLGAAIGYDKLRATNPKRIEILLNCDVTTGVQVRPSCYNAKEALKQLELLLDIVPERFVMA